MSTLKEKIDAIMNSTDNEMAKMAKIAKLLAENQVEEVSKTKEQTKKPVRQSKTFPNASSNSRIFWCAVETSEPSFSDLYWHCLPIQLSLKLFLHIFNHKVIFVHCQLNRMPFLTHFSIFVGSPKVEWFSPEFSIFPLLFQRKKWQHFLPKMLP